MDTTRSRADEWRAHWPLVMAAMIGFSFDSLASYSVGLFMEPLQRAFGWSRAFISAGLSIGALFSLVFSIPVGAMIDRWGARRVALPGLACAACAFALFGTASGSQAQWIGLWLLYVLAALFTKSTVWTYAVSGAFDASRSMAIALTMSGAAVAQGIAPPLTNALIDAYGWRTAYAVLGIGWGAVALVATALFLNEARRPVPRAGMMADDRPAAGGLTLREALRDSRLIRIAIATLVTMLLSIAVIVHQVPILVETGVTRTNAAYLASLTGIASIVGKLATGALMERGDAGWVGSATLAVSSIGFLLLTGPLRTPAAIVVAVMIIAYATGAKVHICAYLTSRYAGLRCFGAIFGVMSGLVALGSGLGPVIAGAIYDHAHSYQPLILFGIPASLVCGLLIFRLGPYPDWSPPAASDAPADVPLPV